MPKGWHLLCTASFVEHNAHVPCIKWNLRICWIQKSFIIVMSGCVVSCTTNTICHKISKRGWTHLKTTRSQIVVVSWAETHEEVGELQHSLPGFCSKSIYILNWPFLGFINRYEHLSWHAYTSPLVLRGHGSCPNWTQRGTQQTKRALTIIIVNIECAHLP